MIRTKSGAITFSLILSLLVFSPIREHYRAKPVDGFPLSHYPMFANKRPATYSVQYVVGYTDTNERRMVPYKLIGSGGFNQVRRQINKMAKDERGDQLLQQASERIQKKGSRAYQNIVRLELVKGWYHLEDYFLHQKKIPTKEITLAALNIEKP